MPTDAPVERLATIIADAGVVLLVASDPPPWLADVTDVQHIPILGDDEASITAAAVELPAAAPDSLFCVIYTSGTTGVPKGACLIHRGFTNLLWYRTRGRFEPGDFELSPLTAPWHFDGSIVQLFSPLITGGTLVACGAVSELGASPWYHRLTALTGASSLIAEVVRQHGPPRTARAIGLGAEPLPPDLLDRLRQSPAFERLLTGYGVTECSCYSTDIVLYDRRPATAGQPAEAESAAASSIGRPIANTRAYLLDGQRNLVPLGVPGELFIAGVGVARGYLHRPELTADRFLRDPFSDNPGALIYRTGDLARWREDGTLEFLGRLDDQVKIRGFRIELGEVEEAIARVPGVRQAVAVAREVQPGDRRLVAYVVAETLDERLLRSHLKRKLPEYMIPSTIVRLDSLPLTSNGKVNRRQLPDLAVSSPPAESGREEDGPIDDTIRSVLALWEELFPGRPIGIHDDFFALGGHSLTAVRLLARVEEVFGFAVPLRTLAQDSTVERFAATLRQRPAESRSLSQLVPLGPTVHARHGGDPPFICFPGCTSGYEGFIGNALSLVPLARALGVGNRFYGVSLADPPPGDTFAEVLPACAERFLSDLMLEVPRGPYFVGGYSVGGLVAVEVARRLLAAGMEVGLLVLFDVHGPGFPTYRGRVERIRKHCANMRHLSAVGMLNYLSEKIRARMRRSAGDRQFLNRSHATIWKSYGSYLNDLPPYPGRITLLRAAIQPDLVYACYDDPTNGWGSIAEGGVEVIDVPGNHVSMFDGTHLPALANVLSDRLRDAAPSRRQATRNGG